MEQSSVLNPAETARLWWNSYLGGRRTPHLNLDDFQTKNNKSLTEALRLSRELCATPRSWRLLTLAGPPGTGKTHLSSGIARSFMAQGRRVLWGRLADILDQLRAANPEALLDRFYDIRYQELMCLDDIAAADWRTEWSSQQLDRLIDIAYSSKVQCLVITTNTPAEQIPPRVLDRLTDKTVGRVVVINAPSHRQEGK